MVSGVPLETCWVFSKLWNNKFYYKLHLLVFLLGQAETCCLIRWWLKKAKTCWLINVYHKVVCEGILNVYVAGNTTGMWVVKITTCLTSCNPVLGLLVVNQLANKFPAIQTNHQPDVTIFQFISWRLFTAQHVSGVFPPIIRSSMAAVAASGFTFVSWC
jgi:hypothetical protein